LSSRGKVRSRVSGGEALFQRMFTRIGCEGRPPHFHVEFYTYSSLVITLRRRGDMFYVRFSDLLQRAPQAVLEGAAALLLARVFRRRPSRALVEPYLEYARSDRTRNRINHLRRGRVRPAQASLRGEHHDLMAIFEQLNEKYFFAATGAAAHRVERPGVAAAVWVLRSRAESDRFEPADGPAGCAAICCGVRFVSRDAACEASHASFGVQPDFAFAGVSDGGKALRAFSGGEEVFGPFGGVKRGWYWLFAEVGFRCWDGLSSCSEFCWVVGLKAQKRELRSRTQYMAATIWFSLCRFLC